MEIDNLEEIVEESVVEETDIEDSETLGIDQESLLDESLDLTNPSADVHELYNQQLLLSDEILLELQQHTLYLEQIAENTTTETQSIWDKPLSEYTVYESLDLASLMIILALVIFKIVGGIITCNP